jgi:hypothetical protein
MKKSSVYNLYDLLYSVLVTVSAYLICGIAYNKIVQKESGAKLIPHYDFWAKMMLNVLVCISF